MRGRGFGCLLALAVAAAPTPARAGCPQPGAAGLAVPEVAAAEVAEARRLAAAGDCAGAGEATVAAYDALGGQPRRHLDLLHALLADALHAFVAAQRTSLAAEPLAGPRAAPVDGPLCAADTLLLRHRARVRALGRATPAFEARLAGVRTELHARLADAGATCTGLDARALAAAAGQATHADDRLLAPDRLAADTRGPRTTTARRWQSASQVGVALMAVGLMTLGGGIATGALERLPHQNAVQAGLLVGGTALFVGGFPLLIVGDQRARAALALGPGGATLRF